MGSGTQHEHSGLPGKEEDKAASLLGKGCSQWQSILVGMVLCLVRVTHTCKCHTMHSIFPSTVNLEKAGRGLEFQVA